MHGTRKSIDDARLEAYAMRLEDIDVSRPELFRSNTMWPYFERLRKEAPVHYCPMSRVGPYWSVTKYKDIMHVETSHGIFSSDIHLGGIGIQNVKADYRRDSFIAMDEPRHGQQRKTVAPMFLPENLDKLANTIRVRAREILDHLPRNETFDWVDRVSVELTTQMLATLFDFPWEERRKLTRWSNVATAAPGNREIIASEAAREAELQECGAYFEELWKERIKQPPKADLISMMAHSEATRDMDPENFLGNLILLIVGGNDTTRNSLSGSVYALNLFPDQYRKLARGPCARAKSRARGDPLADATRAHAPYCADRHRDRRQGDQERRKSRDVVRLGKPRRGHVRECRRSPHRAAQRTQSHRVRLRHSPLSRSSPRRAAAAHRMARDFGALRHDYRRRRSEMDLFEFRQGLRDAAGADSGLVS
jgi:cytochrome P450